MDEPEERPEPGGARPGILPALLIAWVLLYLCVVLGMYWYVCRLPAEPLLALRIHAFFLGSLALLFLVGMSGGRGEPVASVEPEAWLCQHCLKPYVPGAHFCPRCSAPKTFFSGTVPYERAYARAWILGKAAHHPSRGLHVLGLVTFAGITALGSFAMLVPFLHRHDSVALMGLEWTLVIGLAGIQAYLYGALLVLCVVNWRRRRRGDPPSKPEIEYGAPPWFTYDTEWALPEYEVEPDADEEGATPEAG